ncbi:hypothetical protein SH668x_002506 [Planctomicrobium sp. SH668]|uniref:hypothetical protein n=1 Tax=Planctomicrobium sp. SH668 TaxID=3448126 RepID=UPI003F5B8BB3
MAKHLQSYHGGQSTSDCLAWHLHLLLPWQKFDRDLQPNDAPIQDPLSDTGVIDSANGSARLISQINPVQTEARLYDQVDFATHRLRSLLELNIPAPRFSWSGESLFLHAGMSALNGVTLC